MLFIGFGILTDVLQGGVEAYFTAIGFLGQAAAPLAGTITGAAVGCAGGALAGGAAGSVFAGVGAIPGAIGGCLAAGSAGAAVGSSVGTATAVIIGAVGPVIGYIAAFCIGIGFGSMLCILLLLSGMFLPGSALGAYLGEAVPFINILPGWTVFAIRCVFKKSRKDRALSTNHATA